jgi:hypothetical protein
MSEITPEQIIEAAHARHPDATYAGPIYCVHTPQYRMVTDTTQHFELIVTKQLKQWVFWPFWRRDKEQRIATYRAPTLMALYAKLGGREA